MSKIKISLISGTILEKPLVTAFKGTNGDYVVLDNEITGTMGLPIILISKLESGNLVKIADKSAEWDSVKELLRQIIAGAQANYINVPVAVSASDDFYTQLTLPVNSFSLLKDKYAELHSNEPVIPEVAVQDAVLTPAAPAAPVQDVASTPVAPVAPVQDVAPTPVAPVAPVQETQVLETITQPTAQEMVARVAQTETTHADYSADKEAFLKACENMFDALIAKFNK